MYTDEAFSKPIPNALHGLGMRINSIEEMIAKLRNTLHPVMSHPPQAEAMGVPKGQAAPDPVFISDQINFQEKRLAHLGDEIMDIQSRLEL